MANCHQICLNVAKNEFISKISDFQPNVFMDNKEMKQVHECKTFGETVDQYLSWKSDTDTSCKKNYNCRNSVIPCVKLFVDKETLTSMYNAIVRSYFNYYCEVWDVFNKTLSKRLQKLENRPELS